MGNNLNNRKEEGLQVSSAGGSQDIQIPGKFNTILILCSWLIQSKFSAS